jgi:hypothetical protein
VQLHSEHAIVVKLAFPEAKSKVGA